MNASPAAAVAPPVIKVAVVEDSAAVRANLVDMLNRSADVTCVCACATVAQALVDIPPLAPHVILMDLHLPDGSGVDCTFRLKQQLSDTQVMILTVHENSDLIFKALEFGASGYLLKRTPPDALLAGIREIRTGGCPMSSEVARQVIQYFRNKHTAKSELHGLSPRQEEMLRLLARGYVPKEIADEMKVSIATVRSYLRLIYQKLHVQNRTEAVIKYFGE
ncbi:MAG TPA: response regulator transcription factor [Opitutaceae bacterium]|nr:response regulator transcription factor [Opitutaceae bacterium]